MLDRRLRVTVVTAAMILGAAPRCATRRTADVYVAKDRNNRPPDAVLNVTGLA